MASYWDRQQKKTAEEARIKRLLEQSGMTSGTYIGRDGKHVSVGTATQATVEAFPPFLRFTQKVWETNAEINALSAGQLRKLLLDQERAEYELARAYINAVGTPAAGTPEYEFAVREARNFTVPYLRFLKSLQLLTNAARATDPAVTKHANYWTFQEYRKFTTEQQAELAMTVSVCLQNAGIPEYAGIG
jgi:hypothetical protein